MSTGPSERWLPIPGYEGYEASDLGRIRSIDRTIVNSAGKPRRYKGVILQRRLRPSDGYLQVTVFGSSGRTTQKVHKLVLAAFVGPRPEGLVARHLNGDPSDARLVNLTYGTQSENCHDRVRHGTDPNTRKTHCPQGHEYTPENTYVARTGSRNCRQCHLDASRRWVQRQREAVA